jgi:aspartyl-tRNA(Asn)/glutamyl-tRNA(Gln) amidotransferase subunit A
MSIPCGLSDQLPVGLHLVAPHFAEGPLMQVGHQYQQDTDWHLRAPEDFQ